MFGFVLDGGSEAEPVPVGVYVHVWVPEAVGWLPPVGWLVLVLLLLPLAQPLIAMASAAATAATEVLSTAFTTGTLPGHCTA
jgi:hypothetical protein